MTEAEETRTSIQKGDKVTIGHGTKIWVVTYVANPLCTVMSEAPDPRWTPGKGQSPWMPLGTTRTVEIARLHKINAADEADQ